LKYDQWRTNLVRFIEKGNFRQVVCMMTINSLCLFSITEFLDDMFKIKKQYGANKLIVDFNILRWPAFMSPLTLPDDIKYELHGKLSMWYRKHKNSDLINGMEKSQIERLIDYIEVVNRGHNTTEMDMSMQFHDFKSFFVQYDKRRGKSFVKTFPELEDWYNALEIDESIPNVKVTDGKITHFEAGEYESDIKNYNN